MLKQLLFMITAGLLAVVVAGPAQALPFKDVALPEMIDEAAAGFELPSEQ